MQYISSSILSFYGLHMAPTTVGIIGAGIAGPVLAMFLKQKGYNPVVYERSKDASTGGLSLWCILFPSYP